MPNKTPITVSVILTVILLILVAIVSMFGQVVLLNGVISDSQATTALGIGIGCNGVTIILAGIFSRWLAKLLLVKFNWNQFLAVAVTVILGTGLGAVLSFLSIIVGTLAAGIK
ncbi:MAG: hypothetical protein C4583_16460 [Anaerolineaceae bacterium]|nr:MAG: hypothetical protein C4583_16460 [Anaerolineaceae bacterium]